MDQVPIDNIFEYPPNAVQSIRKYYGLDSDEILNDSINSLQEWANKQEHFIKKDFERKHLEWSLVTSKGSIERAKERLDKYCTGRVLYGKVFEKMDLNKDLNNYLDYNLVLLPKFSDHYYRVVVFKMLKLPKNSNDFFDTYIHGAIIAEYLRDRACLNGIVVILDFLDVNVVDAAKYLSIGDMRLLISVAMDCFGLRVKGIHILTSSKMFEVLVSIIRQALSAKLKERITVHNRYESLYEVFSREILPANYGGKEKSLADLNVMWRKELSSKQHVEHMQRMQQFKTDESRRQLVDFNNQYMGTPGSFRRFVVD